MLIALVANTASGGGTDPDRIASELRGHAARVELVEFEGLADGADLPEGADRAVVAGGDGSIGIVARAAAAAGIPIAVVPAGTANDFARARGLPLELPTACALAADPDAPTRGQDIAQVGTQPFVNAAAAGLSPVASRLADEHKSRLGSLAYTVGAVRAGLTAAPVACRVRCDGVQVFDGRAWQVIVGVTGAFGGGSQLGGTDPDDRRLDVAIVPAGPRIQLLRRAVAMRRGRLAAQPDVPHHRGQVIEVDVPPGTAFNVDGDLRECHPARFELLPDAVQVVVPRVD